MLISGVKVLKYIYQAYKCVQFKIEVETVSTGGKKKTDLKSSSSTVNFFDENLDSRKSY